MAEWGSFAFGVVLGWFLYFTNRYRRGEVQLSDVATLLGIIGGGAVTALFGAASTTLFGAYGVGLAVGFFGYFLTLIVLVSQSKGAFTTNWFLDGRRRRLTEEEEIPGEFRAPMIAMDLGTRGVAAAMGLPATPATSPLATAIAERDRAIGATANALRELLARIGNTEDDAQRARLREAHVQLTNKYDQLVGLRLKDILDSDAVRAALAKLEGITNDLVETAQEMKATTDALATAARTIDRVTRVIGFLGGMFP